jgi:hypothetical protein
VNGLFRKAIALNYENLAISLNKVIINGIYNLKCIFYKSIYNGYFDGNIGIVKSSFKIPYPCNPDKEPCIILYN